MPTITQAKQPFRVDTVLGADELLLAEFSGVEAISAPFVFELELISEDPAISGADLLRTACVLTFDLHEDNKRHVHGLIRRFAHIGHRDKLTYYRAEVVPWLWFLSLSTDLKIFQNMSVLEIVEKVFQSQGYADFDIRCTRSYPKREYCVQYRESHLNFVSRLLEEEGIFYFFEHSDSKHMLVLADDNSAAQPCQPATARMSTDRRKDEDVVLTLAAEHSVFVGKVTLSDYDHLKPSTKLERSASGDGVEEVYDYPGLYTLGEDGDRYTLVRLQEREATAQTVTGSGDCRAFHAGSTFELKGHIRRDVNKSYMLTEVRHTGNAGSYRAWDTGEAFYQNAFVAIPASVPYRPPRRAVKPVVHGSQTALVVGKSGEEIWVDKHGRVKVQFYWDRLGKKNENSSCWVRVSTIWAGKGWGVVHIPRIGQEVIVDFLEGDPDRPIITGRVYNGEQVPPYELPAHQTQSGVKSRSSKDGGTDNFNEIRFEDDKGSEVLYIHAEKDKQIVVENDRSEDIGHDETISVGNDQTLSVGNNRSETIGANETLSVSGNRSESIDKDDSLSVSGNRSKAVSKNESIEVSGKRETKVVKDETLDVGEKRTTKIAKDDKLQVGKKLVIDAGDEILIKSGEGSITIKKDGTITIKGKDITINASGKINGKASSDVVLKGSNVKQN